MLFLVLELKSDLNLYCSGSTYIDLELIDPRVLGFTSGRCPGCGVQGRARGRGGVQPARCHYVRGVRHPAVGWTIVPRHHTVGWTMFR